MYIMYIFIFIFLLLKIRSPEDEELYRLDFMTHLKANSKRVSDDFCSFHLFAVWPFPVATPK